MTYTEIIILAVLMSRDRHGYDIKKVAENVFGDNMTINNNTLYTSLHKFEGMDAVSSKVEHINGKPDRHVYSITDKGKEILREMVLDYSPEQANSDYEFFVRVAFFNLIEPEQRLNILKVRKSSLTSFIGRMDRIDPAHKQDKDHSYDSSVVRFIKEQAKNELKWIALLESENTLKA